MISSPTVPPVQNFRFSILPPYAVLYLFYFFVLFFFQTSIANFALFYFSSLLYTFDSSSTSWFLDYYQLEHDAAKERLSSPIFHHMHLSWSQLAAWMHTYTSDQSIWNISDTGKQLILWCLRPRSRLVGNERAG